MCLAALAIGRSKRFPFVLAANRDESFDRAAAPMSWWVGAEGGAELLAGRDLSAGGTWLGLTAEGQLALVTNVREPGRVLPGAASRGELVPQWLRGLQGLHDEEALGTLCSVPRNGFNLMLADLRARSLTDARPVAARWLSNRPHVSQRVLDQDLHGISNAALDTPWPKLVQLKQRLRALVDGAVDCASLQAGGLAALADPQIAADDRLPDTGLPLARERQVSPAFIRIVGTDPSRAVYGTRCSTVVVVQQGSGGRSLHVVERSFDDRGAVIGDVRHDWALARS